MFVETIPVGIFRCNCTVLACETTRKAIVIDPGDEPDRILEIIRGNGLEVISIVHTHAHLDHIMGTWAVADATAAPARLHAHDRPLWDSAAAVAETFMIPAPPLPPLAAFLEHEETMQFGNACLRVIHTPGHTHGSCCFALDLFDGTHLLFSGDTLFRGTIGLGFSSRRKGSIDTIVRSIRDRLLTFDDETVVIPGHGPTTQIGFERRENVFLSGL